MPIENPGRGGGLLKCPLRNGVPIHLHCVMASNAYLMRNFLDAILRAGEFEIYSNRYIRGESRKGVHARLARALVESGCWDRHRDNG
jgi:hypothetical protein